MALENPSLGLQARADHSAVLVRRAFGMLSDEGVGSENGDDDLRVSEHSGSDMKVVVAAGVCAIQGDGTAGRGLYSGLYNDADVQLDVAASNLSNDRIDIVIVQQEDTSYGDGSDDATLQVIEGTPDPSPAAPALPDSALLLAEVLVPAGSSAVVDANITDKRVAAGGGSGVIGCVATRDADQSIANDNPEFVSFDGADFDPLGMVDGDTITIQRDGVYEVGGGEVYENDVNGTRRAFLYKNGSLTKCQAQIPAAKGTHTTGVALPCILLDCVIGDTLQLQAYQDAGGGGLNVTSAFLAVHLIGHL